MLRRRKMFYGSCFGDVMLATCFVLMLPSSDGYAASEPDAMLPASWTDSVASSGHKDGRAAERRQSSQRLMRSESDGRSVGEAVPDCCSGCGGGKKFCSPKSGDCYATQAKNYYTKCPEEAKCIGGGMCEFGNSKTGCDGMSDLGCKWEAVVEGLAANRKTKRGQSDNKRARRGWS